MTAFKLLLAAGLLVSGTAFAQTAPSTSTTSGPISGSGATTSGTAPASVGPTQYTTREYRTEMRNDQATAPKKDRRKYSKKNDMLSPDGKRMKNNM